MINSETVALYKEFLSLDAFKALESEPSRGRDMQCVSKAQEMYGHTVLYPLYTSVSW
jgi:hypothetical protein